jgi:hypothetical protein
MAGIRRHDNQLKRVKRTPIRDAKTHGSELSAEQQALSSGRTSVERLSQWLNIDPRQQENNKYTWDQRERAKVYTAYEHGQGLFGYKNELVYNHATKQEEYTKVYQHIPGFKRSDAPAVIDPQDVNVKEWPVDFVPIYIDAGGGGPKSWRTRFHKWEMGKQPMISRIRANPRRGLMLVDFSSNGAQVEYDHVPITVIADLKYCAENGISVGARFWDLVRYRGHQRGSKFPYWYAQRGAEDPAGWDESKQIEMAETAEKYLEQYQKDGKDTPIDELTKDVNNKQYQRDLRQVVPGLRKALDNMNLSDIKKFVRLGEKKTLFEKPEAFEVKKGKVSEGRKNIRMVDSII